MTGDVPAFRTAAASISLLVLGVAAAACLGGGTPTSNPLGGGDPPRASTDTPPASTDRPPASTDTPPATGDLTGAGGTDPLVILCQDPSAAAAACFSCEAANCASELNTLGAACGSFFSCYGLCACSDGPCLAACGQAASATCLEALTNTPCGAAACTRACSGTTMTAPTFGTAPPDVGLDPNRPPDCTSLDLCCRSITTLEESACLAVVSGNVDASCSKTLAAFKAEGLCA
jgi:hypothetical protein